MRHIQNLTLPNYATYDEITQSASMSHQESQEEEREVLISIYDGDEQFTQTSDTLFAYRVGEVGSPESFLVELAWGASYPDTLPTISLDAFYNNHLNESSKHSITRMLTKEGEGLLGGPMTFSLFEFAKEKAGAMLVSVPEEKAPLVTAKVKKVKKEILTKQQKRRLADRVDVHGERPRGWDWIDLVKLSKTGSAQ